MKARVTKARFLNWFFSDNDDKTNLGRDIIRHLKMEDSFTITIEDIFSEACYIPSYICEDSNQYEEGTEFEPSEVELIK